MIKDSASFFCDISWLLGKKVLAIQQNNTEEIIVTFEDLSWIMFYPKITYFIKLSSGKEIKGEYQHG